MLLLLPLVLLAAAPAPTRVRLVYDAADTGCPSRERLTSAVMARLGYEPFSDDAPQTVEVTLRRSGNSLSALVVRDAGQRELSSPTTDCSELFRALELAVAIAIDPRAGLVRPARPAPVVAAPVPPSPAPVPTPVPAPEKEKPSTPTFFLLGLGPAGSLGTAPTATFGIALMGGLRRGLFELNLGGRVELPSSLVLSPGVITTQALVGNLSVCLAVSVIRACALGELGALRVASSGLTPAAQQTAVLAGVGGRIAAHLQPFDHLALRPFLDVTASLARTSVFANGQAAWVSSPVSGTLGVAVLVTSGR